MRSNAEDAVRRTLAVLLPMLLVLSRRLPAQSVSGSLRADVDNRAIAGAVVLLLGASSDSVLGRTTSSIDGRFVVRAPRAGRFVLRILRLGQRSFTLPAFELADGDVKRIDLTLTRQPIELVAFNVRSDAVCRRSPDSLSLAGQLLTEARTAWQSSLSTTSGVELAADYMMYSRDEDLRGRALTPDAVSFRSRLTDRPFASLSPSVIAMKGYVTTDSDSVWYRGPDEAILLSREFAEQHCFRVVEGSGTRVGAQGIEFRPVETRANVVDIRGTIWMRSGEATLSDVEFFYEPIEPEARTVGAGGRVEFAQIASGSWIVRAWEVRMPRRVIRRFAPVLGRPPRPARVESRVEGLQVEGGVVTRMAMLGADSMHVAYVDSAALARQSKNQRAAAVQPVVSTARPARCGAQEQSASHGAIDGTLLDEAGGVLRDVIVRVQWNAAFRIVGGTSVQSKRQDTQTRTGRDGTFALCGLPIDVPLTVSAFIDGVDRGERSLRLTHGQPVQPIAMTVARATVEKQSGRLRVLVQSASGPVTDAEVVLTTGYGDLRARTDVRGVATFEALQPMETALQVRKVGLTAITVPVTVRGGEQTVEIRMVAATLLGEVRVAANAAPVARLAAVEERRRLGLPNAAFSTEELEATGSSALSLVLRRVPGVRIVDSSGVAVALSSRGERFSRGAMVPCVLRLMVDGVFMTSLSLDAVPMDNIASVEVYLGAARIPATLVSGLGESLCGLIAIWTASG